MTYASAADETRPYCEPARTGTPVIFIHEFAGDGRGRGPQMRFCARSFRCIAYGAGDPRPSAAGIHGFGQ